jgi:hypothetical protein
MATDTASSGDGTGLDFGDGATDPANATVNGAGNSGDGSGDNLSDAGNYERDAAGNIIRNADGSPRKKRGRKSSGGGGNSARSGNTGQRKAKGSAVSVTAIEQALTGIHVALAIMAKAPELALEPDESKPLAESLAELSKHFPMPDISEKAIAIVAVCVVASKVYIPKAILIKQRMAAEKATNVTQFRNAG